jgi:hypothetical protein
VAQLGIHSSPNWDCVSTSTPQVQHKRYCVNVTLVHFAIRSTGRKIIYWKTGPGGMAQVVEHLPSKHRTLSSNPRKKNTGKLLGPHQAAYNGNAFLPLFQTCPSYDSSLLPKVTTSVIIDSSLIPHIQIVKPS